VGAWLDIPEDLHCRLGEQRLGMSATLGGSTWQCQHKFEIVLGPLAGNDFANFLPGARGLAELRALVRLYTNDEWSSQVRLRLEDPQIGGMRLGSNQGPSHGPGNNNSSQLGWTSWLGTRRPGAQDVVIQNG
jgi:type VI secretion system protein ImpH